METEGQSTTIAITSWFAHIWMRVKTRGKVSSALQQTAVVSRRWPPRDGEVGGRMRGASGRELEPGPSTGPGPQHVSLIVPGCWPSWSDWGCKPGWTRIFPPLATGWA